MSTVVCHTPTCVNYGLERQMKLGSIVTHPDGSTEHIWESGVYCVCKHKLHDVRHGPIQ